MDVANADGNKVASCTTLADVASRGMLISLGGRSRIRVLSEGGDSGAKEVPAPEVYALVQAEVIRSGRVTLTRDGLDALCSEVSENAYNIILQTGVVVTVAVIVVLITL